MWKKISYMLQEPLKAKDPQLFFESKLYRILEGGSKGRMLSCSLIVQDNLPSSESGVVFLQLTELWLLLTQLEFSKFDGMVCKEDTEFWSWIFWGQILKLLRSFAVRNIHVRRKRLVDSR